MVKNEKRENLLKQNLNELEDDLLMV